MFPWSSTSPGEWRQVEQLDSLFWVVWRSLWFQDFQLFIFSVVLALQGEEPNISLLQSFWPPSLHTHTTNKSRWNHFLGYQGFFALAVSLCRRAVKEVQCSVSWAVDQLKKKAIKLFCLFQSYLCHCQNLVQHPYYSPFWTESAVSFFKAGSWLLQLPSPWQIESYFKN